MRRLAIVIWVFCTGIPICMADNPVDVDRRAATEFFEKKIRPLLVQRCDECHSTAKADDSGHLALDNRTALLAGGTRGLAIVPGKLDDSLLIKAVRYVDPKLQMPPDGKLPDAEIELLSQWVRDGAFVPDYGTQAVKKSRDIDWTVARQFWSFQPVHRQDVPDVRGTLANNAVDQFISGKLHERGLEMSPQADKRTLIRRLSFDLLGLPPSPDDVQEFIADMAPDAYERLVDRLLASPHFGERWARYWLDLARYVDNTPEWQKNTDRAWMFRDWIVRAINEDRPYDDFVRMQLAADLVPDADPRDFAALGFLGVSPTYWKELKLAPSVIEVIVADEWDERLDTVTRTFLGLTVACARCHDHKFDPVTTRDYYALAGVFASTQVADRPLLPTAIGERVAEARVQIDKLQESLKKQMDKESDEAKKLRQQIEDVRSSTPQIDALLAPVVEEASVYVVADGPDATKLEYRKRQPRDLPVFRRGNPANPGEVVPRRFLDLFASGRDSFQQGSGRLELAHAIVNDAESLTARVAVNRIWSSHFGKGLVKTPGDFGQQGERPSHPELLEWLVSELVGAQSSDRRVVKPPRWSMKRLHRVLMTSATYRQANGRMGTPVRLANDDGQIVRKDGQECPSSSVDADNHWLSRMNRRRLEIEPWRDAMLSVAGNLDDRLEGPGMDLDQPANLRRTLYSRIGRDEQNDMLRIYDFPLPTTHSPARDITTTPLQQLFVFNSEFVERQASLLASRLMELPDSSIENRIDFCYQQMFQRLPSDEERQLAQRFLESRPSASGTNTDANGGNARWRAYVQSLFGLNEFLFID